MVERCGYWKLVGLAPRRLEKDREYVDGESGRMGWRKWYKWGCFFWLVGFCFFFVVLGRWTRVMLLFRLPGT